VKLLNVGTVVLWPENSQSLWVGLILEVKYNDLGDPRYKILAQDGRVYTFDTLGVMDIEALVQK
jgi:hypothetical protein